MKLNLLNPTFVALTIVGISFYQRVDASTIVWSTGPNFDGPNGFEAIDTSGTLIEAVNLTGTTTGLLTVDPGGLNIVFTPRSDIFTANAYTTTGFNLTSDAAWNEIISSVDYTSTAAATGNFNLTGLLVGRTYQIQLFSFDNRDAEIGGEVIAFSDGLGNNSDSFTKGSATSIIGRFTADTATQNIRLLDDDDHSLNAYVLREVPEPPFYAALLTAFGLIGYRRYRYRK